MKRNTRQAHHGRFTHAYAKAYGVLDVVKMLIARDRYNDTSSTCYRVFKDALQWGYKHVSEGVKAPLNKLLDAIRAPKEA